MTLVMVREEATATIMILVEKKSHSDVNKSKG